MRAIISWFIKLLVLSSLSRCDDNFKNYTVLISEAYADQAQYATAIQESLETEENDMSKAMVISTNYGDVRGYEIKGTPIWKFLDIPYAAFDIDDPFQEPTEPVPWENIRQISEHTSHCPQLDSDEKYTGSVECLTLSVFVPSEANDTNVLFHIHDGGFFQGSGDPRIYGPGYLVPKDVILVLPNYRLGPLGFLCLQNSIAPGNAALKDLTMALKWVRENIEIFGGNPLNIVVSGSGTGAALAEYLALSPESQKYISKVITESGTVLSHWAIDRTPLITAAKLVTRLNNTKSTILVHNNIFSNTSIQTIIMAAKGLIFRPCVDNSFLHATPWHLLQGQKLNQSFMLGTTDRPGLHKAMIYTEDSVSELNKNFGLLLPNDLAFEENEQEKVTGKRVKIQYFGNDTITLDHRNELSLCYSDCSYLSPGIRTARLISAAEATVFLYEFSIATAIEDTKDKMLYGAAYGESLKFVFQRDVFTPVEGSEEFKTINLMTNLWVSFINTGTPMVDGIEWEEFKKGNESDERWLSIGNITEVKRGFHLDRLSLWTEIYAEYFIDHNVAMKTKPIFPAWIVMLIGCVKQTLLT